MPSKCTHVHALLPDGDADGLALGLTLGLALGLVDGDCVGASLVPPPHAQHAWLAFCPSLPENTALSP